MVELGRNVVEAAKAAGITYIVRASEPLADAASELGAVYRAQGEVDDLIRQSGIPHCVLRPNWFM